MRRPTILFFSFMILMCFCVILTAVAMAESAAIPHGQEDLSKLTYKQLKRLESDVSADYNAYHVPTDSQKNAVLKAVQNETQKYYFGKRLEISGWAWYDREYTYTRDWDFYTLKTHLDYKDSNKKSQKAIIYAELHNQGGKYEVCYLKTDSTVILDTRSEYTGPLWYNEPKPKINKITGIDLSTYTTQELDALDNKIQREINNNHSVSKNEANVILSVTKTDLEQYCLKKNYEIKGYAWYDSEYTYLKDWDYYWLETHVDYKTSPNAPQKTSKIYSEVCKIGEKYELVYLKLDEYIVITNRKKELEETIENGIPRYARASTDKAKAEEKTEPIQQIADARTVPEGEATPQIVYVTPEPTAEITPQIVYITPEPTPEATPQIIYVTPEPTPETTPEIVYITQAPVNGVFCAEMSEFTDEQLANASEAIRKEQRARIKTHITLDSDEIILLVGVTKRYAATIEELPEDEKIPQIEWSTSDKTIFICNNRGEVKGVGGGKAVLTCSATLSDGTVIYTECDVTVNVPVASFAVDNKNIKLSKGDTYTPEFTFRPENATIKELEFCSSDEGVATVSKTGIIKGVAAGKATITAKTVDGTEKQLAISVTVTNDAYLRMTDGKVLFDKVVSGEWATIIPEGGSSDWYDRAADIGGVSFEVHTMGKNGKLIFIEVMDLANTGNKDIFFKVLDNLFEGDDLVKATNWIKSNLGRETRTKIGDANIILQRTVSGAPIMYIMDDEHVDWV